MIVSKKKEKYLGNNKTTIKRKTDTNNEKKDKQDKIPSNVIAKYKETICD